MPWGCFYVHRGRYELTWMSATEKFYIRSWEVQIKIHVYS